MQGFRRITQGKAEEKQSNGPRKKQMRRLFRRYQRLTAHYRENQKKQGDAPQQHPFVLWNNSQRSPCRVPYSVSGNEDQVLSHSWLCQASYIWLTPGLWIHLLTSPCLGGTVQLWAAKPFLASPKSPRSICSGASGRHGAMRIAPEIRVRGVKKTILSPYQIFRLLSKTLKVHETRAALSFHCWEVFRGSLFWPVKIKEQAQKAQKLRNWDSQSKAEGADAWLALLWKPWQKTLSSLAQQNSWPLDTFCWGPDSEKSI